LAERDERKPYQLDTKQVLEYANDLKELLAEGTFREQKAFLRSFIKRIDFAPDKIAISYTIPVPIEQDRLGFDEVLFMGTNGEPNTSLATPQVETFFELTLMSAPDILSRHGLK